MSGGTKKEETKQNTVQEVRLPQWMTDAGQGLYSEAKATADANPVQAFGGQMAAGAARNQSAASNLAATSQGTGQRDLQGARAMTYGAAMGNVPTVNGGTFGQAEAQQYSNPYTAQVQGRTLQEMMRQNGIQMEGQKDAAQASKAYGGTRDAVLQAETAKGQNANMMDYLANSNAAAYSDAQGQFERDRQARMGAETTNAGNTQSMLDRLLAAGGQAAGIGEASAGLNTRDIANLSATGAVDQATEQNRLGAAYQEFLRMQDAPMERYRDLTAILSGQPRNVTTTGQSTGTSTQTQSGGLLNSLLGIGQLGAAVFSDPALKRDFVLLGRSDDGLGVYRYRNIWDDEGTTHVGVRADEVAALRPDALGPEIAGFRTVDYENLGEIVL